MNQADQNTPTTIQTDMDTQAIKDALSKMSKRGKLAGYKGDVDEGIAEIAAHGVPFDSKLIITHQENHLNFESKLLPMMPAIFGFILIISIWPGLPLTDVFLNSFERYERFVARSGIETWYWYLPLTILPAPFAWKGAIKKSKRTAQDSLVEAVSKIQKSLDKASS